jgi:galactosamine-6-phosphate isomerase
MSLNIEIAKDYEAMSERAAEFIVAEVKECPKILWCVSAGGTPTKAYERLAARRARQPGLFKKLRVLQIDEWHGLPPGTEGGCAKDLETKLLGPLGIGPERYVGFKSDATNPEKECRRIEYWLARNGPIDVCLLGLGLNGHIAMNEPSDVFVPHPHMAKLSSESRRHPMLKQMKRKPSYGLTLGMGDILRSRKILLLVSGLQKQIVLKRLMGPRVTTRFPASFLWLHRDVTVLCDRDAAG